MNYPMLRPRTRKEFRIDRFPGLDCSADPVEGSFRDEMNLAGDRFPAACTAAGPSPAGTLDGCPTNAVLAAGGRSFPVILDASGSLWSGGNVLLRLLPHVLSVTVTADAPNQSAELCDESAVRAAALPDGDYVFVYDRDRDLWVLQNGSVSFAGGAVCCDPQQDQGETVTVRFRTALLSAAIERSLVFLGGWVCVFPDGVYANAVRLNQGAQMSAGEDYGSIAVQNDCNQGGTVFTPCSADGQAVALTVSAQAPASGLWVDPTEPEPVLRTKSRETDGWVPTAAYVKCKIPGIAKGVSAGDGVQLLARLSSGQEGEDAVMELFDGPKLLIAAYHDPGAVGRSEGTEDYVVIPGLLGGEYEIELTYHNQDFFSLRRVLPTMDYVVEAQNRLWGCRWSGGVNELYGCKLGDFRNWEVFEGLSTDSYRVSRGETGPFTGAASLGGHPLFFREHCLEKIYPAAGGDHGVVTVHLSGIREGSARSAAVIRDRLYYHGVEGVFRYDGTLPVCVSRALGRTEYRNGCAGTRGGHYYLSLTDPAGSRSVFSFDPETGVWHRQSGSFLLCWSFGGQLYYADARPGPLRRLGSPDDGCAGVAWYAETHLTAPKMRQKRYLSRLQITACLEPGAELRVKLSCDGGAWYTAGRFTEAGPEAKLFSVWPRRSGRIRLRLEGEGGAEIRAISWLVEAGSDAA